VQLQATADFHGVAAEDVRVIETGSHVPLPSEEFVEKIGPPLWEWYDTWF
jgi:hypothetical protein